LSHTPSSEVKVRQNGLLIRERYKAHLNKNRSEGFYVCETNIGVFREQAR
jgi:hypothetical protein